MTIYIVQMDKLGDLSIEIVTFTSDFLLKLGEGGSRKHQKSEVLMVESSTNQLKLKEEELVILIKLFID